MEQNSQKKVCIIGAGPYGLVAARHLSEIENIDLVVFEAQSEVGGVWIYREESALDTNFETTVQNDNYYSLYNGLPNALYDNLTTNVPFFLMEFKDIGMRDVVADAPWFINNFQYKKYLDAYADRFGLRRYITFEKLVTSVRLTKNLSDEEKLMAYQKTDREFLVKTVSSKGNSLDVNETYHDFDYVLVVGGQSSVPYIPHILGIEKFKGKTIHAKDFRSRHLGEFEKKRVLILGGNFSAYDMLNHLLSEKIRGRAIDCQKAILCSRKADLASKSDDYKSFIEGGILSVHPGHIKEFKDASTVCFSDETEEKVDVVFYATGYKQKFPYLDQVKGQIIDHNEDEHRGAFFGPLYKKFISIRCSNIFFIGYLARTPFAAIIPELESLVVKNIIEGKLQLPSQEEMKASYDNEIRDHLRHVGDLAHFQKRNLGTSFKGMSTSEDREEVEFLRKWLIPCYPNNNKEKALEYYDFISEAGKLLYDGYFGKTKYLSFKELDFSRIYRKEVRNTSEFI